jgi:transposase
MLEPILTLSFDERMALLGLVRHGTAPARTLTRARILLHADDETSPNEIARVLHVSRRTVDRACQRYADGGLAATLYDCPRPGAAPVLGGTEEAILVALACSAPPPGRTKWTMQLLADELVVLEIVPAISADTVGRTLKKTR